jgi:hypothetical protein
MDAYPSDQGAEIAGNYSYKMNMFQVGMIMWTLVTRCMPPRRRTGVKISNSNDDSSALANSYTYGSLSEEKYKDNYDKALLGLIAVCMAEKPADRPSLETALEFIETCRSRIHDSDDTPETVRLIWDNLIGHPPPPMPREEKELQDVSLGR